MTQASTTLCAPVKWAQRKDSLYVTVDLPDVADEEVTLTDKSLKFKGTSNGKTYQVELEFFKEVDTEAKESKWAVGKRNVHFYILKKDKDDEFWPRLLQCKTLEKTNVKTDWDKYVDEDEEGEDTGFDMSALAGGGGFDMNQMMAAQQMQQNMGVPEPDSDDDDDDDLPDLESVDPATA